MILDDGSGYSLELHVEAINWYGPIREPQTDDWLRISMRATSPAGDWSAPGDECLMIGEVVGLTRWLRALGEGKRPSDDMSFLEPNVRFRRLWDAPHGQTLLRIELSHQFEPPETISGRREGDEDKYCMALVLSPHQLLEASISIETELRSLLAYAGVDGSSLFALPSLTPRFFVEWAFMPMDAETEEDAVNIAKEYMEWAGMPLRIEGTDAPEKNGEGWLIYGRTELPVSSDDHGEALFRLLSHLPMPFGYPGIGRARLGTDGPFSCDLVFVPRPDGLARADYATLRWMGELRNFERVATDRRRVRGKGVRTVIGLWAGEVDERGRPTKRAPKV